MCRSYANLTSFPGTLWNNTECNFTTKTVSWLPHQINIRQQNTHHTILTPPHMYIKIESLSNVNPQAHWGNMDCLKFLVIFIISATAVTGFQLSSSLGKFNILPVGALLERFAIPLYKNLTWDTQLYYTVHCRTCFGPTVSERYVTSIFKLYLADIPSTFFWSECPASGSIAILCVLTFVAN